MAREIPEKHEIDPTRSLHLLKEDFRKRYAAGQCDALRAGLDSAIAATEAAAPVRTRKYFRELSSQDLKPRAPAHPEARWEEALYHQWKGGNCDGVPDAWKRIVHYQVMLRDENAKDAGWGEVDLLGMSNEGVPVVIELKGPTASDTPASMLVQAAAYAIALRKAWRCAPLFRKEWNETTREYGLGLDSEFDPRCWPLVCAAPAEYWVNWVGDSAKARRVSEEDRAALRQLVSAFSERGLPATFVKLTATGCDNEGRPTGIRAEVIQPFI